MENPLSSRELEVLTLLSKGYTNKEIAQELFISTNTVRVHISNIYQKLGVNSRIQASRLAMDNKWLAAMPHSVDPEVGEGEIHGTTRNKSLITGHFYIPFIFLLGIFIAILIGYFVSNFRAQPIPNASLEEVIQLDPGFEVSAASIVGENIYYVGGDNVLDATSELNIRTLDLTDKKAKNLVTTEVNANVVNGNIYLPGGDDAGSPTESFEFFDPQLNKWQFASDLPMPLSGYASASLDGQIYLIGGWDGVKESAEILRYNPDTDEWRRLGQLPESRRNATAVVYHGQIVLVGGTSNDRPIYQVIAISPGTDLIINYWETSRSLPDVCVRCRLENMGDMLFLISPTAIWQFSPIKLAWVKTYTFDEGLSFKQVVTTSRDGILYLFASRKNEDTTLYKIQLIFTQAVPGVLN